MSKINGGVQMLIELCPKFPANPAQRPLRMRNLSGLFATSRSFNNLKEYWEGRYILPPRPTPACKPFLIGNLD